MNKTNILTVHHSAELPKKSYCYKKIVAILHSAWVDILKNPTDEEALRLFFRVVFFTFLFKIGIFSLHRVLNQKPSRNNVHIYLTKVTDIISKESISFVHQYLSNSLSKAVSDMFQENTYQSNIETRNVNNPLIVRPNSKLKNGDLMFDTFSTSGIGLQKTSKK